MLTQDIKDAVNYIANNLPPEYAGELANFMRGAIENANTTENLEVIDAGLLSAGVDVTPFCRKRVPT